MGSAGLSKGSTVLNWEIGCDNLPCSALSISGSLCGRRQIAKGSGHTMMWRKNIPMLSWCYRQKVRRKIACSLNLACLQAA